MKITTPGFYRLTEDVTTRGTWSIGTLPRGTVIEITQVDAAGGKVIGPHLADWRSWDMPAEMVPNPIRPVAPSPPETAAAAGGALPFPDDAGPRCDACKGRGWVPGDCHPREVCGTCHGTGYPQSWEAKEIARLDSSPARSEGATDPLPDALKGWDFCPWCGDPLKTHDGTTDPRRARRCTCEAWSGLSARLAAFDKGLDAPASPASAPRETGASPGTLAYARRTTDAWGRVLEILNDLDPDQAVWIVRQLHETTERALSASPEAPASETADYAPGETVMNLYDSARVKERRATLVRVALRLDEAGHWLAAQLVREWYAADIAVPSPSSTEPEVKP